MRIVIRNKPKKSRARCERGDCTAFINSWEMHCNGCTYKCPVKNCIRWGYIKTGCIYHRCKVCEETSEKKYCDKHRCRICDEATRKKISCDQDTKEKTFCDKCTLSISIISFYYLRQILPRDVVNIILKKADLKVGKKLSQFLLMTQ